MSAMTQVNQLPDGTLRVLARKGSTLSRMDLTEAEAVVLRDQLSWLLPSTTAFRVAAIFADFRTSLTEEQLVALMNLRNLSSMQVLILSNLLRLSEAQVEEETEKT